VGRVGSPAQQRRPDRLGGAGSRHRLRQQAAGDRAAQRRARDPRAVDDAHAVRQAQPGAEQQLAEGRVTPGADDEIGVGRGDVAAAALARPHDEPADRLVEGDVVDGQAIDLDHSGRA